MTHFLSALKDQRARIAGEIADIERRADRLRAALAHVDGVLAYVSPETDAAAIRPRKPCHRVFGKGELGRLIKDVLRRAERPLTTQEVVDAVAFGLGCGPDVTEELATSVLRSLRHYRDRRKTVVSTGTKKTPRWMNLAFERSLCQ